MGIVQYLQVVLFVFSLTLSTEAQEKVTCQNFKFAIDRDVIHNQILEGHVFERLTVPNAIQCHLKCKDDCLCVSMNYFPLSKSSATRLGIRGLEGLRPCRPRLLCITCHTVEVLSLP